MLETRCFGSKKTSNSKCKATWVGKSNKVLRQFWVSIKSYIVYPFVKKDCEATRKFFEAIYSARKVDDLIFDGNDHEYLKKIKGIIDITKQYDCIYDCGCGNGSFYQFLIKEHIKFNQYIGVDFAIQDVAVKKGVKFVKSDLEDFEFNERTNSRLVVLCNVSCYLSNHKLSNLLEKLADKNTTLLIIDPIPGCFWDATFDSVKLFYRSPRKMIKLLSSKGFVLNALSKDYLFKIGNQFIYPLSYAGMFRFSEEVNDI